MDLSTWGPSMCGIMRGVVLCDQPISLGIMSSRFIHVKTCMCQNPLPFSGWILFLCMSGPHFFIQPLIHNVASAFGLLWIVLTWIWVGLFGLFRSLGYKPEAGCQVRSEFFLVTTSFYIPTSSALGFQFLCVLTRAHFPSSLDSRAKLLQPWPYGL